MSSRIAALGLDLGRRRIGVAGCDGTGLIATGLTTIVRRSFEADMAQLQGLIDQRQVEVLVVGLPYAMNGSVGKQAQWTEKYARRIAAALQVPLEFVDERLTSVQAEELIRAEGRSPSWDKGLIDRKAAAIILQQWLDAKRDAKRADRQV